MFLEIVSSQLVLSLQDNKQLVNYNTQFSKL